MILAHKVAGGNLVLGSKVMLMCQYCHLAGDLVNTGGLEIYCEMSEYLTLGCKGILICKSSNGVVVVEIIYISFEPSKLRSLQDMVTRCESSEGFLKFVNFDNWHYEIKWGTQLRS